MQRFRMRPREVHAIQFDGTDAGVERVIAWLAVIVPGALVRPRTEYAGWCDPTGHIELEARDVELGCMSGDWIVVVGEEGRRALSFLDDAAFRAEYEELSP